ncbi:IS3 family transposase [Corynebacterium diphtheriae]
MKAASAFFRIRTRPETSEMIRFIDEHRNRFSVEFICQTLNTHREGGFLTSRGYRQSKARGLSSRALRDAALVEHIRDVHADNYGVYGVRKMWHALRREGIDIGREQTARLMRLAGVTGKGKGGAPVTTRKPTGPDTRPDLVGREFKAPSPNRLWVADITYVRTRKGFVYTAFVTDVYSWRIIGWMLSDSMRTSSLAAAGVEPGDRVRQGNNGSDSSLRPRLAVCEHRLQRALGRARYRSVDQYCWRFL